MQKFLYSFLKKYSGKKNYNEDISCGIMDLKYDDNKSSKDGNNSDSSNSCDDSENRKNGKNKKTCSLKILEFGEIEYSAFKGHEFLYGPGKIWGNLWQYLAQFKKQIWYVSSKVSSRSNDKAIEVLYKLGGLRKKSFEDLEKDNKFKQTACASTSCAGANNHLNKASLANTCCTNTGCSEKVNPHKGASEIDPENTKKNIQDYNKGIQDYKGIIVIKNRSNRKTIKDKLSEFIVLNDKFTKYCENKHNAAQLFKGKELEKFKPNWKTYNFAYTPNLAKKILKDLGCDAVVIKPINATRGEGVIIVEKKDLDKTLKKILCDNNPIKNINNEYAFWAKYKENIFLVESFEKSKSILVDKKKYDATMRIVFVMCNNACGDMCENTRDKVRKNAQKNMRKNMFNNACENTHENSKIIEFKIIGAYWKLPIKSISEKGSLNDRHKSKITPSAAASAKVSEEDIKNVGKIMEKIIPKIYKRVLEP